MRASLIGSSIAHLTLLIGLFVVPSAPAIVVPGPDVVQVALIEPGAVTMPPAVVPPPEPEVKAAEIEPTEDTGVKLNPPKPVQKKPEKPEKTEQPAPRPQAVSLPYAPVGTAGLSGQVSVDAANFEFTYYLLLVRNRVAQNWAPPAGLASGGQQVRSVVYFRIARDGGISATQIETGSGVEFFDRSSMRAVLISDPLPPLPLGFGGSDLGVHFGFEYSAP